MYHHIKKLQYTVNIGTPDVKFGNLLLEQFGGANGELAAAMQSPSKAGTAWTTSPAVTCSSTLAPKNSAILKSSVPSFACTSNL